jgi:hypothetical protein
MTNIKGHMGKQRKDGDKIQIINQGSSITIGFIIQFSGSASVTSSGKDTFFTQAGLTLAAYCKSQEHQQVITFFSMMTSPEKEEILAMNRNVTLSKMRAEQQ